jgi:hypothetical protein
MRIVNICYGTCSFEGYMGECDSMLLSCKNEIKETTGFTPCFIGGGSISCPEEDEYWNELDKQGKIEDYTKIAYDVVNKEYERIRKIWSKI